MPNVNDFNIAAMDLEQLQSLLSTQAPKQTIDVSLIPISSLFGLHPPVTKEVKWESKSKPVQESPFDTLVGVEVEVENIEFPIVLNTMWNKHEDGSLRNNGVEYVTHPTSAKYIPIAINSLYTGLNKKNKPSFSDRTSIHCHINVQDMTMDQLKAFILLYLSIENLLYEYVGYKRKKSIFCVPLSHSGYVGRLKAFFNSTTTREFSRSITEWHKYTGCNIIPVKSYGTVEFRHLYGTGSIDTIINWLNVLLTLKEYAMTANLEQLFKTIVDLNTSSEYEQYLNIILGRYRHILSFYDVQHKMEKDVTHIKTILTKKKLLELTDEFKNSKMYSLYQNTKKPPFKILSKEILKAKSVKELQLLLDEISVEYNRTTSAATGQQLSTYYTTVSNIIKQKGG